MKRKLLSVFLSVILLLSALTFISCDYLPENDPYNKINAITETSTLANVKIENRRRASIVGGSSDTLLGSGVIIKELVSTVGEPSYTYHLLTNNHVITKGSNYSQTLLVYDRYGNSFSGSICCFSDEYDLAVVKFTTEKKRLKAISIKAKNEDVGKTVFSIGSPNSQYNTITCGKLTSYVSPPNLSGESSKYCKIDFDVIRHSAKIANGSSGGMLINENLEIVGINYAGDEETGIGYAIPAEKIIEFLNNNEIYI